MGLTCMRCHCELKEALLDSYGGIKVCKTSFTGKLASSFGSTKSGSHILVMACPNCGHLELFAANTDFLN